MDNFEASQNPQEQSDLITTICWNCGENKICKEYIICCTGTKFHNCLECEIKLAENANKNIKKMILKS